MRIVLPCCSRLCAAAAACAPLLRLQGTHGDGAVDVLPLLQGAPGAGGARAIMRARRDSIAAGGALCGRSADPAAAWVHGVRGEHGRAADRAIGAAAAGSHVTRTLRGRPANGYASGCPMSGCPSGKLHAGMLM